MLFKTINTIKAQVQEPTSGWVGPEGRPGTGTQQRILTSPMRTDLDLGGFDIIGEGNSFGTSPNCIGYGDLGAVWEKDDLGDIITDYPDKIGDVSISDFPQFTKSSYDSFENNFDVDHFSNGVIGKSTSAYYLIVRIGSDEWEKALLIGAAKVEEIDRNYFIYTINKTELFKHR